MALRRGAAVKTTLNADRFGMEAETNRRLPLGDLLSNQPRRPQGLEDRHGLPRARRAPRVPLLLVERLVLIVLLVVVVFVFALAVLFSLSETGEDPVENLARGPNRSSERSRGSVRTAKAAGDFRVVVLIVVGDRFEDSERFLERLRSLEGTGAAGPTPQRRRPGCP